MRFSMDGVWASVRVLVAVVGVVVCLMLGLAGSSACLAQPADEGHVRRAGGAGRAGTGERYEYSRLVMGTKARIVVYAAEEREARLGAAAAFEEMLRLEALMTDYRADSALCRISERAGEGAQQAPAELVRVLKQAQRIADLTDGAFDPTVGRATRAWRAARDAGRLPSEEERERLVANGYLQMLVDEDAGGAGGDGGGTVELLDKNLRLDLGGIGKGYAAQRAVEVLKARGLGRCLVALSGDISVGDAPPGAECWVVQVDVGWPHEELESTRGTASHVTWGGGIRLVNQSVSTSGDAEQHVVLDGVRYSHIVNPATGLGLTRPRAACVVSSDGATADALATALCVLGPERARGVLARFDHEFALVMGAEDWEVSGVPSQYESEEFPWTATKGTMRETTAELREDDSPWPEGRGRRRERGPVAAADDDAARLAWFRDARFGLFIHWGLYSVLAGEWEGKPALGTGEWIQDHYDIAPDVYEKTAARFNPVKFDAKAWAALAREAGMKYIVITTKHHEGFSLFDSAHSAYDVMDATPFKRDIMRELADATRAEGLRIGWYHSIMDWHHPNANPFPFADAAMNPPNRTADWAAYAPVLRDQVRELLTKYGPIGVMWFDGEWVKEWTDEQGWAMYRMCRELQPSVLVNNRVGKGRDGMAGLTKEGAHAGDFGTPEQEVPGTGLVGVDWESCMTMNDTWGYNAKDANWKSSTTLIRTLIETASKGGNFLLNVGPTGEGEIPRESVERLREMGKWMKLNGEAIYGTRAGPFKKLKWEGGGRCTSGERDGGPVLYAHVFEKSERVVLPGLKSGVRRVWALADATRRTLACTRLEGDEGWAIDTSGVEWGEHATVLVVELDGPAEVVDVPMRLIAEADGAFVLKVEDANTQGSVKVEHKDGKANLGFWSNTSDRVWWEFAGVPSGRYRVVADIAVDKVQGGGELLIDAGEGATATAGISAMGTWSEFSAIQIGELTLGEAAGPRRLTLQASRLDAQALLNLRSLRLEPVR